VTQSKMRSEAQSTKANAALKMLISEQESEVAHKKAWSALEIKKAQQLSEIEAGKFKSIVGTIGAQTLKKISQAGPEMQAKLLAGLGLKSFMVTDGNHPINLFSTALGLIGNSGARSLR